MNFFLFRFVFLIALFPLVFFIFFFFFLNAVITVIKSDDGKLNVVYLVTAPDTYVIGSVFSD